MILPRNICEALGPIFSCKNLISHIKNPTQTGEAQRNYDETRNLIVSPKREVSSALKEGQT
jgi:hypothetical protein